MGIAVRLLLLRYFAASRLGEAYKSSTASANRAILIEHGARSMVTVRAARHEQAHNTFVGVGIVAYRRKGSTLRFA